MASNRQFPNSLREAAPPTHVMGDPPSGRGRKRKLNDSTHVQLVEIVLAGLG